jgi:hypothetical protein
MHLRQVLVQSPEFFVAETVFLGVIERGHIYFFYRPKVEHEEVHSIDDVRNLMMLLVPSPPGFSVHDGNEARSKDVSGADEMNLVAQGADAAPAPASTGDKKHFRLIIIGKKSLPSPEHGKHDPFWATVITVGENLHDLEEGLGEKSYETKTRGMFLPLATVQYKIVVRYTSRSTCASRRSGCVCDR